MTLLTLRICEKSENACRGKYSVTNMVTCVGCKNFCFKLSSSQNHQANRSIVVLKVTLSMWRPVIWSGSLHEISNVMKSTKSESSMSKCVLKFDSMSNVCSLMAASYRSFEFKFTRRRKGVLCWKKKLSFITRSTVTDHTRGTGRRLSWLRPSLAVGRGQFRWLTQAPRRQELLPSSFYGPLDPLVPWVLTNCDCSES